MNLDVLAESRIRIVNTEPDPSAQPVVTSTELPA